MPRHLQRICSKFSPMGCSGTHSDRRRTCRGFARLVEMVGLDQLQTSFEVAGLDRPDEGVDHRRDPRRLARCDQAGGECGGDRLHRSSDIGSALDRRQDELHHTFAAWRQNAFEAEPHCAHGSRPWTEGPRGTDKRQLDRLAGQRLGLPREQCRSGHGRLVAAADLAAGGIADRPFSNGRPRTRPGCLGESPSVIVISLGPTGGPILQPL
jgi:hypothetical protein